MFFDSERRSVVVSMCLTVVLALALGYVCFLTPAVADKMIAMHDEPFFLFDGNRTLLRTAVLAVTYWMLAVAFAATVLLFFLLRAVLRKEVFGRPAVKLLYAISLCCFVECLSFVFLAILPVYLAAAGAAAACFLGVSVRVVAHVLEEGGRIKSENDFTI